MEIEFGVLEKRRRCEADTALQVVKQAAARTSNVLLRAATPGDIDKL